MSKSASTEAQIIAAVKQVESGRKVDRPGGGSVQAHHPRLEAKMRRAGVAEAQELKHVREENSKRKKLAAEYALDKEALKWVIAKNGYRSSARWRSSQCRGPM